MGTENRENIIYFPDNIISEQLYFWYFSMISDFQLESIYEKTSDSNKHIYRFIWERAHNNPIIITIEIFEIDYGELHLTEYSGGVFYPQNEIISNCNIKLIPHEVKYFLNVIDEHDFWNSPSKNPNSRGLDGSTWIIEGLKNGKYHFIERWAPMQTDNVAASIGLKMLELSRIKIDRIY